MAELRRQFGIRAVICHAADRLCGRLIDLRIYHVFCYELGRASDMPQIEPGLTFRFLTAVEVRSFAADPVNELAPAMADRIASGHDLCFGVLSGERLAGYGWCALRAVEPEHAFGMALSYPSDVAYMYKGFTHREFRGRRLNGLRMALAERALAERGVRKLVALVDWTNWASIRSCRQAGCIDLGRVATCSVGGRRCCFVPKAAREMGVRFGEEAESHPRATPTTATIVHA